MEQKNINKTGMVYLILCIAGALSAAALNFFSLRYYSDYVQIGDKHKTVLYTAGALPVVTVGVIAAFVLFLCTASVSLRRIRIEDVKPAARVPRCFITAACGMALIFTIPMQFLLDAEGTLYMLNDLPFSMTNSSSMQKVFLVLAAISSFYFFIALFTEKRSKTVNAIRTILGLVLVFSFCTQLLVTHEYMNDMLRSPTRVYSLLSYCFLIFFFLLEVRQSVKGREKPAVCAAMGMIAFLLTFTEAVPILTLSLMGEAGYGIDLSVFYLVLRLFLGLYALLTVCPILKTVPRQKKPEKEEIEAENEQPSDAPVEAAPEKDGEAPQTQPSGEPETEETEKEDNEDAE